MATDKYKGPSIIRCIKCEGKTVMDGLIHIATGHGNQECIRCVCLDCLQAWGIYEITLPGGNKKMYQKKLTPKSK